jgi:hypothetical protein
MPKPLYTLHKMLGNGKTVLDILVKRIWLSRGIELQSDVITVVLKQPGLPAAFI